MSDIAVANEFETLWSKSNGSLVVFPHKPTEAQETARENFREAWRRVRLVKFAIENQRLDMLDEVLLPNCMPSQLSVYMAKSCYHHRENPRIVKPFFIRHAYSVLTRYGVDGRRTSDVAEFCRKHGLQANYVTWMRMKSRFTLHTK
jgi:hypothetical protein